MSDPTFPGLQSDPTTGTAPRGTAGPLFSVIIPAYNAASILPECLTALKNQSCGANLLEIIVVDDGSTDDTAGVAARHGAVVVRQAHANQAAARNNGAAAARGDILLFTDADCVPDADWVRWMTEPFQDRLVAGVTGRYRTRQPGLLPRFVQLEFDERYERLQPQPTIDFIDSYSAAYRTEVFRELGGFDAAFPIVEDIELSFRCQQAGFQLVFAPKAVVYHRHRERLNDYFRTKRRAAEWWVGVYGKHPGKIGNDSRQPRQILVQIGLAGVLALLAPLALFLPPARWALAACLTVFTGTTVPVIQRAARHDRRLAASVPFFSFVRAASQVAGIAVGVARRAGLVPS